MALWALRYSGIRLDRSSQDFNRRAATPLLEGFLERTGNRGTSVAIEDDAVDYQKDLGAVARVRPLVISDLLKRCLGSSVQTNFLVARQETTVAFLEQTIDKGAPTLRDLWWRPVAAAAINAVIESIEAEGLLQNVRQREAQIREQCKTGPVQKIQGMGLLLGLVCDRPAIEVRNALLEHDVLAGTSADPNVLRILAPLVLESSHVDHLAHALQSMAPKTD